MSDCHTAPKFIKKTLLYVELDHIWAIKIKNGQIRSKMVKLDQKMVGLIQIDEIYQFLIKLDKLNQKSLTLIYHFIKNSSVILKNSPIILKNKCNLIKIVV